MRRLGTKVATVVMALMLMFVPVMLSAVAVSEPVLAAPVPAMPSEGSGGANPGETSPDDSGATTPNKTQIETSILPENWEIKDILGLALNILVYGLGVAATLGVIIAGIMYMTARDSEQQVAQAKKRLYEIVIGLVAWALMYAVLNWLIPGGLSGLLP